MFQISFHGVSSGNLDDSFLNLLFTENDEDDGEGDGDMNSGTEEGSSDGVNGQADLPIFVWAGNTLRVTYTNGKSDSADMVTVFEDNENEDDEDEDDNEDNEDDNEEDTTCIMTGTFKVEDVEVSVTGCPGDTTFDVR